MHSPTLPPPAFFRFYQQLRRLRPGQSVRFRETPERRVYLRLLREKMAPLSPMERVVTEKGTAWWVFTQPPFPGRVPGRTLPMHIVLPPGARATLMRADALRRGGGLGGVELLALRVLTDCIRYDVPADLWKPDRLLKPHRAGGEDVLLLPLPVPRGVGLPRRDGLYSGLVDDWARWLCLWPLWSRWGLNGFGTQPLYLQVRASLAPALLQKAGVGTEREVTAAFRALGRRYWQLYRKICGGNDPAGNDGDGTNRAGGR